MSEADQMNSYATAAGGTPDANSQTAVKIWDIPAKPANGSKFTLQLDQNSCFWTIYPASSAYTVTHGQGSVDLEKAMRRFGML